MPIPLKKAVEIVIRQGKLLAPDSRDYLKGRLERERCRLQSLKLKQQQDEAAVNSKCETIEELERVLAVDASRKGRA